MAVRFACDRLKWICGGKGLAHSLPNGVRRYSRTESCATREGATSPLLLRRPTRPRATPAPLFRRFGQPGFHRIVMHVPATAKMFFVISDPVVVGLRLPKRLTRASQNPIRA